MRRHLLILLTVAIMIPSFSALLLGGAGLVQHERAMERVARSYVVDIAEYRLETGLSWSRTRSFPFGDRERFMRLRQLT